MVWGDQSTGVGLGSLQLVTSSPMSVSCGSTSASRAPAVAWQTAGLPVVALQAATTAVRSVEMLLLSAASCRKLPPMVVAHLQSAEHRCIMSTAFGSTPLTKQGSAATVTGVMLAIICPIAVRRPSSAAVQVIGLAVSVTVASISGGLPGWSAAGVGVVATPP